jgi:alpha 1,3-glucosidase
MYYDPYTLTITPGNCGRAEGLLYLDDESSFAHEEQGMFAIRKFTFTGTELQSTMAKPTFFSMNKGGQMVGSPNFNMENIVERIVLAGQTKAPKRVFVRGKSTETTGTQELSFFYDGKAQVLTVKKPSTRVLDDWTIVFEY